MALIVSAAVIGARFPLHLNDTSSATVCPSQSDVVLVLRNFSNPDYSSVNVTHDQSSIPENMTASTIVGLVGSIQPVTITYQRNVSLQQARNIQLYVLPGSLFIVTFSFPDGSMDKNLTVQFRVYTGAAHPGRILHSQPVGPSTISRSVSFLANESSYVEVMIENNHGLTGYYAYTFLIKELHNLDSEHKCTVNSTIGSCVISPTLPGQNIILGLPTHDSEIVQCQPIIDVSLMGQKTQVELITTIPIAVLIVSAIITAITITTGCVLYDRFAYR